MARKKVEGLKAILSSPEPVSIQEITMMDWYAGFALMSIAFQTSHKDVATQVFDLAEAIMEERAAREKQ